MKAYEDAGVKILVTAHQNRVHYYPGVSYCICSKPRLPNNTDTSEQDITTIVIKAGNIVEFASDHAPEGRAFGRVIGIMQHQSYVFLVIRQISEKKGPLHPHLGLREFIEQPLFQNSCFRPLMIVNEQRFVDGVYFQELDGKLFLNPWIFPVV